MVIRTGDLVELVQETHKLDVKALFGYASAHVPGFPPSPSKFTLSKVFLYNILYYNLAFYYYYLLLFWFWDWLNGMEYSLDMVNRIRRTRWNWKREGL